MPNTAKVINESYSDWNIFNNQAGKAVFFSDYAYKQQDQEMQELANEIPEGYELFLMTDHMQEVGKAYFRCVAFLNQDTKEIVFATAGSRFVADKKA